MKKLFVLAIVFFICLSARSQALQSADYVIENNGANITAFPKPGTSLDKYTGTDSYTILQAAINALTRPGATGTGGGHIHLSRGVYVLSDELLIKGWENNSNPFSQLIIDGEGYATQIVQNTPGKNAMVVKNAANIVLRDLRFYTGVNAGSCLLGDSDGSNSEISCYKSVIDNVTFGSNSTSSPAVYLKNFFDLSMPSAHIENTNNHGMILENNSATTNYGNSNFGFIRCYASSKAPYAGLLIRSTNATKFINQLSFSNYECTSGYYGIYSDCLKFSTFNFVDIEYIPRPLFLTGNAAGNETRNVNFGAGYLFPSSGNTAITNTLYTASNDFHLFIEGDKFVTPILDQSAYRPPNSYNVVLSYTANAGNIKITSPDKMDLTVRLGDGNVIKKVPGTAKSVKPIKK